MASRGGFRGGAGAGRGGGSRGGGFGGRGGGGFRGGRGGGGAGGFGRPAFDAGPPEFVVELGTVMHACEGEIVCRCTNEKVPYFNAYAYLENKTPIGKIDEILGPITEVMFTIKPNEGVIATSFKAADKVYIGPDKLLPMSRFTNPPPSGGGGGRGGGRGGFGDRGGRGGGRGFSSGGRGGFVPRGRGGSFGAPRGGGGFRGAPRGGGFRGAPRGGSGGGFRGRGAF